jgi:hypothetical protein
MKAILVLAMVTGCMWRDSTSGGNHEHPYPDSADPGQFCGPGIVDGEACNVYADPVCEWSEGIDAGTALPVQHCVCRFDAKWKCQTQQYATCRIQHHTGDACGVDPPCEYPLEADAGPGTDIICTCAEGTWVCQ